LPELQEEKQSIAKEAAVITSDFVESVIKARCVLRDLRPAAFVRHAFRAYSCGRRQLSGDCLMFRRVEIINRTGCAEEKLC
jgi:hypothetical protein